MATKTSKLEARTAAGDRIIRRQADAARALHISPRQLRQWMSESWWPKSAYVVNGPGRPWYNVDEIVRHRPQEKKASPHQQRAIELSLASKQATVKRQMIEVERLIERQLLERGVLVVRSKVDAVLAELARTLQDRLQFYAQSLPAAAGEHEKRLRARLVAENRRTLESIAEIVQQLDGETRLEVRDGSAAG